MDGTIETIFLKPGLNIPSVLAKRTALLMKENRIAPVAPHYIRQSDAEIGREMGVIEQTKNSTDRFQPRADDGRSSAFGHRVGRSLQPELTRARRVSENVVEPTIGSSGSADARQVL